MKKTKAFIALLSLTVVVGSLQSGTGAAQGCLYEKYQSGISGFSEPFSNDPMTQTSFLESREMTTRSAAAIAGLFGLSWLFRQYKIKKESVKPVEQEVAEDKPTEAAVEQENKHPEAPGEELDVKDENQEEVITKEEQIIVKSIEKEEEKEEVAAN